MSAPGLAEVQRLFHRLVTAPENVTTTLGTLGIPAKSVESAFLGDARLSAIDRLDIYADMYFFRIRDVLREQFERVGAAVGDRAFHDLVTDYLVAFPPRSPSLRDAGDRLGEFLTVHPLGVDRPWLADLARLEWFVIDLFDGPDFELLSADSLRSLAPEDFESLPLLLVPTHRFLATSHRIDLDPVTPEPCTLLVSRCGFDVNYRAIDALELRALRRVAAGCTFGEVCELVASDVPEAEAASAAFGLLSKWLGNKLLRVVP